MKTFLAWLSVSLILPSCATGRHESGNLARFMVQNLKDYGADFPRIDLHQPAIGIDQLYTSWRSKEDPGGFSLLFNEGVFDGVEHQMKEILGPAAVSVAGVWIWRIDRIAHIDLVRLPTGKVQLTCRRLAKK